MGRHRPTVLGVAVAALTLLLAPASLARPRWLPAPAAAAKAPAHAKGKAVRVIKVQGPVGEVANPWDPFGLDQTVVMSELLRAADDAAGDPSVGTVVFKVRNNGLGLAQARELADAVRRLRAAGKLTIAHAVDLTSTTMIAMSGVERLLLTPEGRFLAPGLRAEVSFFKDMMATVGVEADIEAVGRYKSAAEPLTRSEMSEPAREALDALLDSVWDTVLDDVAEARKLKRSAVIAAFDRGLMTAEEARKRGLIDAVAYWGDLLKALEKDSGQAPALAFPKPPDLPNLSSVFGLFQLLTRQPSQVTGDKIKVALLTAEGPITQGRAPDDPFAAGAVVASDDLLDAIEAIANDESIKAVVLRIDSPGGSALASDLIWRALARLSEDRPLVASLGNTAASGGYYIASAARHIVAQPTTVTGSIGVFGGKLVLGGLYDKLGMSTVVLSRGKNAGLFSSQSRFSDSEREVIRETMRATYDTFVNRVARGRKMSYDAIDRVAQGRVWTGRDAKAKGLVDELGGLQTALDRAARLAGVEPSAVELVRFPEPKSLLQMLQAHSNSLRAPTLDLERLAQLVPGLAGSEVLHGLAMLRGMLAAEPILAMSPYRLQLR